jgi:hypothetical protein
MTTLYLLLDHLPFPCLPTSPALVQARPLSLPMSSPA